MTALQNGHRFSVVNGKERSLFLLTPSIFNAFWTTRRMLILALGLKMLFSGCGLWNLDFGCGPLLSKFGGCVVGVLGVSND